jgi:hypothetical protein
MTKGYKKDLGLRGPVHVVIPHEFTNSVGETFKIQGLPPLTLPNLAVGLERPKKPTYSITTAAGDIELHEHDASTLQTPEDREAWQEYIALDAAFEAELSERMLLCILVDGVVIPDDVDLTRWESRQRIMHREIPDDFEEKLLAYKRSTVIKSGEDIKDLMRAVMDATGIGQEAIDLAKKSFPDTMESKPSA